MKNEIIFRVNNSSSRHIDDKNKDILILGKDPTQELRNTTFSAKAECSINFKE